MTSPREAPVPDRPVPDRPVREVPVRADGIRLGQLLKLAGLVDSGADVKALVAAGSVAVNGETETRRGRQLTDGDEVAVAEQRCRVVVAASTT